MGKAIVLNNAMFSDENLGQVTIQGQVINVSSIVINGTSTITEGGNATYSITYRPSNTTQIGVTWEIVGSPSGISVSANGNVTVAVGVSVNSFTLKATSNYNSSVYATKTVDISAADAVFSANTIATGNINTSNKTSNSAQFVHYNGFIEARQGQTLTVVFPTLGSSYNGDSGCVLKWKVSEFSSAPANVLTTSGVTCTSYITGGTDYIEAAIDSSGGSSMTYEVQESGTNYVYLQWTVLKNGSRLTAGPSTYGDLLSEVTCYTWALVMTENANGYVIVTG